MKYIMVVLAGAADFAPDEAPDNTAFEIAKIPNLHYFAKQGRVGTVSLMPRRKEATADAAFMNLLGYDPERFYTGIAPLEAANLGLKLGEHDVPFRLNFVTESDGYLVDPFAGNLSTKEGMAFISYLSKRLPTEEVTLYSNKGCGHIAVLRDSHGYDGLCAHTYDPETIVGENIDNFLPSGAGQNLIRKVMAESRKLLIDHEINQVRVDLMENPANLVWLWGQGRTPRLPDFKRTTSLEGALVSRVDYACGTARLCGLDVIKLKDPVGNYEADLGSQGKALVAALEERDFVCCYVNDADMASRHGDLKSKVSALEATDYFLLSWVREFFEEQEDVRVLVTTGHVTPWRTRRPASDPAPFALVGRSIAADDVTRFTETAARATSVRLLDGKGLWESFSGEKLNV